MSEAQAPAPTIDQVIATYLTIPEVASQLRCSPETIRRRIKSGELEARLFAGSYKITQAAIDKMIEAAR